MSKLFGGGLPIYLGYNSRAQKNYTNGQLQNAFESINKTIELSDIDDWKQYSFSTPSSSSGRADIIGEIDTEDLIIIEVKIFDSTKGYEKKGLKVVLNRLLNMLMIIIKM